MANFVAQTAQACRTIAQRLVDAKAPGLAGRLDALPTRLFTLPGTGASLSRDSRAGTSPFDHSGIPAHVRASPALIAADARQAVGWSVTREALLNGSDALRVDANGSASRYFPKHNQTACAEFETWLWRQSGADGMPQCAVLISTSYRSLPEPRWAATWLGSN